MIEVPKFKCCIRGCKKKGSRCVDPKKCDSRIAPRKYSHYCEDHKIVYEEECRGYRFILEAQDCGCHVVNKLYEPNNPKPIREGRLDLEFTAPLLMWSWTKGIDGLIKLKKA